MLTKSTAVLWNKILFCHCCAPLDAQPPRTLPLFGLRVHSASEQGKYSRVIFVSWVVLTGRLAASSEKGETAAAGVWSAVCAAPKVTSSLLNGGSGGHLAAQQRLSFVIPYYITKLLNASLWIRDVIPSERVTLKTSVSVCADLWRAAGLNLNRVSHYAAHRDPTPRTNKQV